MLKIGSSILSLIKVRAGYFALILVGVAPLLVLTSRNLVRLVNEDPNVVDSADNPQDAAQEQGKKDPKREEWKDQSEQLAHVVYRPYAAATYTALELKLVDPQKVLEDPLLQVSDQLMKLRRATNLVEKAKDILPKPFDWKSPREELDTDRDKMREVDKILQDDKAKGISGDVSYLEAFVQRRWNEVDDAICLRQAHDQFQEKQYQECLNTLTRQRRLLREPDPNDGDAKLAGSGAAKARNWSPELKEEAAKLAHRAQFRVDWFATNDSLNRLETDDRSRQQAELRKFMEKWPSPPDEADDTELKAHKRFSDKLLVLDGTQEIANIMAREDVPLGQRLKDLHNAVERFYKSQPFDGRQTLIDSARENVKDILLKGIVVKNCRKTEDESFREVEKKDGTLFVGIFENGVGYLKYWKDKAQSRDERAYQPIHPEDIVRGPCPLTPISNKKQYEASRENLIREFEKLDAWQNFAEKCELLQKELDNYAAKGGDTLDLKYSDEIDFAKTVISVWSEHIQPILKSPSKF